jgi:hypothetical protein
MLWDLARYRITGVPIMAKVSFIRKDESMPVPNSIRRIRWSQTSGSPEETVGLMKKKATPMHCLSDHKHAKKKDHHI